jgi:hypothetical protein
MTSGSIAVPGPGGCGDGEPQAEVSIWTAGEAAEILALIGELIAQDPAVTAAITRFLHRKGADPGPAAAWLTASITRLAGELDAALAFAGFAVDGGLARFWRRPAR